MMNDENGLCGFCRADLSNLESSEKVQMGGSCHLTGEFSFFVCKRCFDEKIDDGGGVSVGDSAPWREYDHEGKAESGEE